MANTKVRSSYSELVEDPLYKEFSLPDMPEAKDVGKRHGFNRRLRQVLNAADRAAVEQRWDEETKAEQLREAIGVLHSIQYGLFPIPSDWDPAEEKLACEKCRRELWWHRDPQIAFQEGRTSLHGHRMNKEALLDAIADYIKLPWMQDRYLDWLLCDALVFFETYAVAGLLKEEILKIHVGDSISGIPEIVKWDGSWAPLERRNNSYHVRKLRNFLLMYVGTPLVICVGFWVFDEKSVASILGALFGGGLILAFTLNKVLAQFFPYQQERESVRLLSELWKEMSAVYTAMGRYPLNPGHIKATLLAAMTKGAVWDGAVFAILERAIQQNPVLWECIED